jgi:hypothetical protein
MKWALYALGIFVALIGLVFLTGSLLAKQHTATRAARFHQSPETIWGVITAITQGFQSGARRLLVWSPSLP